MRLKLVLPWTIVGLCATLFAASDQPVCDVRRVSARVLEVEAVMPVTGAAVDSSTAVAQLVPVPNGVLPSVEIVVAESSFEAAGALAASQDVPSLVSFGRPALAGGVEVAPLLIARQRKAIAPGAVVAYRRVVVRLTYPQSLAGVRPRNAMGRFVTGMVGRFDADASGDGYLIIVPDAFYDDVLPLAAWKERKGLTVWVKKTSETGTTREQIRSYIQTAYATWDPAPGYVLLVGGINQMPAFINGGTPCVTDHPYACVDGDDFLADLFVGRLPATSTSELDVMVAKVIGYESAPMLTDTAWYHRALMVGTSFQQGGTPAVTAIVTKRLIRERLLERGFTQIDTVYYPPTPSGRGPVDTAVNNGVLFINGRGWGNHDGWQYPSYLTTDVPALHNGWKLPVITSIYCGTGNYQSSACFGSAWLSVGTPTVQKGAVAFWGSSYTGTSTRWNNCMDYAIYQSIFDGGVHTCGPAMYAGKLAQYRNFPLPGDSTELRTYFHVFNLLGDPALEMWTGVPQPIDVSRPDWVPEGTTSYDVVVLDGRSAPVSGARVCLSKSGEVHAVGETDIWGAVRFAIPPVTSGTMLVTVTGPNLVPYLNQTTVGTAGVFVGHYDHSPASAAPGSSVSLGVTLKNYGNTTTATGVSATLRVSDGSAAITDSVQGFGDLGPGVTGSQSFGLTVAAACTSGQRVPLMVTVTSGQGTWQSAFDLVVQGPTLKLSSYTVHDGNGWLDPGESVELSVMLRNFGAAAANGLTAVLRSLSPDAVGVGDSVGSFGSIAPGDSASNLADRFTVHANSGCGVGRRFSLRLVLRGSDGFEFLWDFPVTVGQPVSTAPSGPDRHGYYAYDDTDAGYAERPSYSWVEVDPNYGGGGARLNITNDTCIPVNLPFTFRFYGHDYNTISVSDNGFAAPGSQWIGDVYNWSIPSASGTDGVLAAFWDDFRTDTLGASGVYTWQDDANHRFVIEWSRCVHVHGYRPPSYAEQQTFELMLYDPQYHSTPTGDGPIVVQYATVRNDDTLFENNHNYATVGMESPDRSDGIEYTYANRYMPGAAVVVDGRAIRFTTIPPDDFIAIAEQPESGAPMTPAASPNPVRDRLIVRLPAGSVATKARVYDVRGVLVRSLRVESRGATLVWDLGDERGERVSAGVYNVVLTSSSGRSIASCRTLVLE